MADYHAPAGIALQNAGGTALNYAIPLLTYDETSFGSNVTGPIPSTALASNVLCTRIGNSVIVSSPGILATGNSNTSAITYTNTIPSGFTPLTRILSVISVQNNSGASTNPGQLTINTNGLMVVNTCNSSSNTLFSGFSAGTTTNGTGFQAWSVAYSLV